MDENGVMMDDFEVGEFDPEVVENWTALDGNQNQRQEVQTNKGRGFKIRKFPLCPDSMREYIPCLDNVEAIKKLNSTEKGERFERHCPENGKGLNCLVPAPRGYRPPILWPTSRDQVKRFQLETEFAFILLLSSNWYVVDSLKLCNAYFVW